MIECIRYNDPQWAAVAAALGDISGTSVSEFPDGRISFSNLDILKRADLPSSWQQPSKREATVADFRRYLEALLSGVFGSPPITADVRSTDRKSLVEDLEKTTSRLESILMEIGLREVAQDVCGRLQEIASGLRPAPNKRGPKPNHRWEMFVKAIVDLWIHVLKRDPTSSRDGPLIALLKSSAAPIAATVGLSTYGPDKMVRKLVKDRSARPPGDLFNRLDLIIREAAVGNGLRSLD